MRVLVGFLLGIATLITALLGVTVHAAEPGPIQDIVIAPDGSYHRIDAFDSRMRANMLIVYTPEYGSLTGTTDAHTEIIVVDNRVVEVRPIGFNNSPIPPNGYVLSANLGPASWLRANLAVGDTVEIRRNAVVGKPTTATRQVTRIGPNVTRGANELVVFTPGRPTTGTNSWGIEAVVRNGVVVSVGGNNNPIPADGFVLSGHGTARAWINDNVHVGSYVSLEGQTLSVSLNSQSFIYRAREYMDEAEERLAYARAAGIALAEEEAEELLRAAAALLDEAEILHENGDEERALQAAVDAFALAREAALTAVPSSSVALRGAWYRPVEFTRENIASTLERLERNGINALFLEVLYSGRSIYPSQYVAQRMEFFGRDMVQIWAEEAARRGIDLHLWVHVFRLGDYYVDPVLRSHPEWLATGLQTDVPDRYRAPHSWVDPAHPEARAFLLDVLAELMAGYDVAGLHLDYIRYPRSHVSETLFAITDYSRQVFQSETGIDPVAAYQSDEAAFARWQEWKEDQITSFVGEVAALRDKINPDLVLTAAVGPYITQSRFEIGQNWVDWAEKGYVDVLIPMLYSPGSEGVVDGVRQAHELIGGRALLVAGIGPYLGFSPELVLEQNEKVAVAGSLGAVMFDLRSLGGEHFAALTPGLYRRQAIPPYRTAEALNALGTDLLTSLSRAGGDPLVEQAARMLQAYGTDAAVDLEDLQAILATARDTFSDEADPAQEWQAFLLAQAGDIVSVALHLAR